MENETMNEYNIPQVKIECVIEELHDPELAKRIAAVSDDVLEQIHRDLMERVLGPPQQMSVSMVLDPKPRRFMPMVTFDGC